MGREYDIAVEARGSGSKGVSNPELTVPPPSKETTMTSKSGQAKVTKTKAKRGPLKDLKPARVKQDSNVTGGAGLSYGTVKTGYTQQK